MTASTAKLRKARGKTHGDFAEGARICQGIMDLLMTGTSWTRMNPVQKETAHMIAHKLQRIVTGDPDVDDHWDDIAGYAHLPIAKKQAMAQFMESQKNVRSTGRFKQAPPLPKSNGSVSPSRDQANGAGNKVRHDRPRKAANRRNGSGKRSAS